jgi:MFS family permease
VLAAFLGVMVSFGSLFVFTFSVFLKPLSAEFGWSRESVSAAFGIAAMSVAATSPLLGRLLDRHGPRPVILPCMTIYGLAFASLSLLSASLAHLYAVFLLMGIVGNGTTQMGYARAVASWFSARRGLALALTVSGVGAGAIVFPPLAQTIIDSRGWRSAYLLLGGTIVLLGIPLTALFVRERGSASDQHGHAATGIPAGQGLRMRPFWILAAVLVLSSTAMNGALTHFAAALTDRGVAAGHAALALSVLGAMSLAGRLLTGALLDRFFGPRITFLLLAGASAGIAILTSGASAVAAFAAAALIGLGLGGEADVIPYLLARYFGLKEFSTLYGFTWTAYAVAGGAGPVIMGRVFDLTGSYTALLWILSALTLAAGLLALALPAYPGAFDPRSATQPERAALPPGAQRPRL